MDYIIRMMKLNEGSGDLMGWRREKGRVKIVNGGFREREGRGEEIFFFFPPKSFCIEVDST